MKVAYFQFFPPTLWTPGGGEVQLAKTRAELIRRGVNVELFDIWHPSRDHDILHVFGSTYQLSDFVVTAKRLGQKVVLSPIILTDKPRWQWRAGKLLDSFSPIPTIYRYRKRIYDSADVLLPGSKTEALQLHQNFGVPWSKMKVVPVGVEDSFLAADPDLFQTKYGLSNFVLMVGRMSTHKGQRRLLKALAGTDLQVVFIGQADPDDPGYFEGFIEDCRRNRNARYLGPLPHDSPMLASAYAACKVHALPSFGECPGIVSMEAGLAGAAIVAGRSAPVLEALGDEGVNYCDPGSVDDIRRAVIQAFESPRDRRLRQRLEQGFVWSRVGAAIAQVYSSLSAPIEMSSNACAGLK
jgi:glycosyltransferase involved in cell wall biosynthesis